MPYGFMDIAATPGVRSVQAALGVEHLWRDFKGKRSFDRFTTIERAFIAERDTFYMATTSETGWPYVQHRGGPPGFLRTVDDRTLAFPDFRGNLQYLSLGNLSTNDRASLILMDYPRRRRLKIYARVEAIGLDDDPALTELVCGSRRGAEIERILVLRLAAFDWNCPQHIVPRFTEGEIAPVLASLRERLAGLEAENAALRSRPAPLGSDGSHQS